jgi:hypothetical protein
MIAQGFNSSDEEVLKAASSSDDDWKREKKSGRGKNKKLSRTKTKSTAAVQEANTNKFIAKHIDDSSDSGDTSSASSSYDDEDDNTGSDFSEEEVGGRLSDATSESEDERKAAKRLRQEARDDAARGRKGVIMGSRKGSAQPLEHKITLVRSASTMDWELRMKAALDRAQQIIDEHHEPAGVAGAGAAGVQMLLASLKRPTRKRPRRQPLPASEGLPSWESNRNSAEGTAESVAVDAPSIWRSSRSLLDTTGSVVVITFPSGQLPPMFCSS